MLGTPCEAMSKPVSAELKFSGEEPRQHGQAAVPNLTHALDTAQSTGRSPACLKGMLSNMAGTGGHSAHETWLVYLKMVKDFEH